ncbi:MAG: 4-hydroxy-3-methylbut-2-en-1-yl diphosphate synthase, partial [Candidatus Cloacimonadota bacterium]
MIKRKNTKVIQVGNMAIGGDNPISIQSMTTTKTADIKATVQQIKELAIAGCDIVRVAVPDLISAEAIKQIKQQISIPLIADIPFDYQL